jgi:hypothetical protein
MDVRLPDGTVIRNVPEGTTKAQLVEKLRNNGYDVSGLEAPQETVTAPAPSADRRPAPLTMDRFSPLRAMGVSEQTEQEFAAGAARGLGSIAATIGAPGAPARADLDRYISERFGVSPESGAYSAGQLTGEIAATLPVPGALGGIAARIPGLAKYAPAISSAGFSTGTLAGPQALAARVGGGALAGGASAGLINPAEAPMGAALGSVIAPAGQLVLGGARMVADRLATPATVAANALMRAGGEDLLNALRRTSGMETTPGFKPTLTERAYEGGVRSPSLAKLETSLAASEDDIKQIYDAQMTRVNALRQQLEGVENQLSQQAQRPEAAAQLNELRNQLNRTLAAEEKTLRANAQQLQQSLRTSGTSAPGEVLAERAGALRQEVRKAVVEPAYRRAFEEAGDAKVNISNVLEAAAQILGKPLTEFAPETAPGIVKELMKFAPKAPPAKPLGTGPVSSRVMAQAPAPTGPATATLEELDALRRVINAESSSAARGTSPLSATEVRNLSQLHRALDDAVAGSTTLTDDAKSLYAGALETYRTQFVPRFKSGETARLLQPSTFNETRLLPKNAVSKFFSDEDSARQFVTTFGNDPQARSAMAEGIESLFRSDVVNPATKQVDPNKIAAFLENNRASLDVFESGGVSIRPRLKAVQKEAEQLAAGFDNLAALRKDFGGATAQDVLDRLLSNPSRMNAAVQRLDANGKQALSQGVADRLTNMMQSGDANKALKYMVDNEATVKQALGGKDVWVDMKDLAEQYIQMQKVSQAFAKSPLSDYSKTATDALRRMTPAEVDSLKLVAQDIKRADAVLDLAGVSKATSPKATRAATEAADEAGIRTPAVLDSAASLARAAWKSLAGKIDKKTAAELTHFMYVNPDAAIAALERVAASKQARKVFTGQAGRGITVGGVQATPVPTAEGE